MWYISRPCNYWLLSTFKTMLLRQHYGKEFLWGEYFIALYLTQFRQKHNLSNCVRRNFVPVSRKKMARLILIRCILWQVCLPSFFPLLKSFYPILLSRSQRKMWPVKQPNTTLPPPKITIIHILFHINISCMYEMFSVSGLLIMLAGELWE